MASIMSGLLSACPSCGGAIYRDDYSDQYCLMCGRPRSYVVRFGSAEKMPQEGRLNKKWEGADGVSREDQDDRHGA